MSNYMIGIRKSIICSKKLIIKSEDIQIRKDKKKEKPQKADKKEKLD